MYRRTRTQTHWQNACDMVGDDVDSGARCLLLTISQALVSFRTASCIIRRKIASMVAELELAWRVFASEQVGVSSYLLTGSPLRILIHGFFVHIRLTHYSVLSHSIVTSHR